MFAGFDKTVEQIFGINLKIGSIIKVAATILTLLLNVKNIFNIRSYVIGDEDELNL